MNHAMPRERYILYASIGSTNHSRATIVWRVTSAQTRRVSEWRRWTLTDALRMPRPRSSPHLSKLPPSVFELFRILSPELEFAPS